MAPPTDHGTGPPQGHATTPPGATTPTGSITPQGATTPTGSITPKGATTHTASVTPMDTAPYPFFVEYGSFKRASPEDRIRVAEIDGDVALNFISPTGQTEIIASTKILSEASPVFRKMLAPGPRGRIYTNEKPQVTLVEDWHLLPGVLQLCLVLHGKADKVIEKEDDGTLMLLRFAQVAKKVRAVEFLKPVVSYSLLAPFVPRVTELGETDFQTAADLAITAYLLDQEQLFQLFTRRLIMDHCNKLSDLYDLFEVIPAKAMLQLEEKRSAAKYLIDYFLRALTRHKCTVCDRHTYELGVLVAIGEKLNPPIVMWPPDYFRYHTIRDVLAAMASLDDYPLFAGDPNAICADHTNEPWTAEEVHARCKKYAKAVSVEVCGLFFECVKNVEKDCCKRLGCPCRDIDESLHEMDPIT